MGHAHNAVHHVVYQSEEGMLPFCSDQHNICPAAYVPSHQSLSRAQTFVLADTTYNSLGVDEVAAQHASAHCVVSSQLLPAPKLYTV